MGWWHRRLACAIPSLPPRTRGSRATRWVTLENPSGTGFQPVGFHRPEAGATIAKSFFGLTILTVVAQLAVPIIPGRG
jgi:hypothetical protein